MGYEDGMNLEVIGTWNLRDVGASRARLPPRCLFRSGSLHRLDSDGWAQLTGSGVRAVVDLRTTEEMVRAPSRPPTEVEVLHVPLEDGLHGTEQFRRWFESGEIATPLYYIEFFDAWGERVISALEAIASAGPGVLIHCKKGCDRTGMLVGLILDGLGVERGAIASDYLQTQARIAGASARRLGVTDDTREIAAVMQAAGKTLEDALVEFLDHAKDRCADFGPMIASRWGLDLPLTEQPGV